MCNSLQAAESPVASRQPRTPPARWPGCRPGSAWWPGVRAGLGSHSPDFLPSCPVCPHATPSTDSTQPAAGGLRHPDAGRQRPCSQSPALTEGPRGPLSDPGVPKQDARIRETPEGKGPSPVPKKGAGNEQMDHSWRAIQTSLPRTSLTHMADYTVQGRNQRPRSSCCSPSEKTPSHNFCFGPLP